MPFDPNSSFWLFLATTAIIVQTMLQRHWSRQVAAQAKEAGRKTEEMRVNLQTSNASTSARLDGLKASNTRRDAKVDDLKATSAVIHALVNNRMALVLRELAVVRRHLAQLTGVPTDVAAAEMAEAVANEHDQKQAQIDQGEAS